MITLRWTLLRTRCSNWSIAIEIDERPLRDGERLGLGAIARARRHVVRPVGAVHMGDLRRQRAGDPDVRLGRRVAAVTFRVADDQLDLLDGRVVIRSRRGDVIDRTVFDFIEGR